MRIRNGTKDDALAIATIHVKTWQAVYKGQIPDSYLNNLSIEEKTKSWEGHFIHPEEGKYNLVVEEDEKVVGWCTVGFSRDNDISKKEVGELYGIYLLPEYIGRGLGTKLMEYALDVLRKDGYKKATLWVLTTNQSARMFYEKKGWKVEGKTKIEERGELRLHEMRYIKDLI